MIGLMNNFKVMHDSDAEALACWNTITLIMDSPEIQNVAVESALELMNCLNLNN